MGTAGAERGEAKPEEGPRARVPGWASECTRLSLPAVLPRRPLHLDGACVRPTTATARPGGSKEVRAQPHSGRVPPGRVRSAALARRLATLFKRVDRERRRE